MSLNSKARSKSDRKSLSTTTTPTKSAVKELPGKLAKEVKHQFRRLDGVLHHVIHPRHHGVRTHAFSVTSPSSPIFYPIDVARAFLPPDESSATRSVHSRDVKYAKEVDSIDETPANHSIDLSMSVGNSSTTLSDRSDEHHLPQEEPQLNLHEQATSTFDPTVTSPNEPGTPDPILVDDNEEYSLSKEEEHEEKASSDANTHQVVLPSQAISLDLPSTPDASISQTETSSDAQEVVLPSQPVSLDLPSTPDASISQTEVASDAQQVVLPSHPVSLDIPSIPDSSIPQTQASSNSQQVVLPSQAVPLDIPSTPDASTPQTEVASDAQQAVLPSQHVPLDIPSIPDASVPQTQASSDTNPQKVVLPSQAVLLDLPSSSIAQPQASSGAKPQQVVLPSQAVPFDVPSDSIAKPQASSDAKPQQVVSPSQVVPLDLPSSPEASIPQPLPKLQSNIAPLPASEVLDLDVPALAVPSMFLPIPHVRRSFSPNLLTWWLPFSPFPPPPITRYFASIPRILTSRRLLFLVLLLLIRDSAAPLAAFEALALFATF